MIGNHRDAWTYGSLDPSSATAVLLEISRSLSDLKKSKIWSPRRSIIFLSWDCEEYGLVGSTEWVEEFLKKISTNAVVYINSDIAVTGMRRKYFILKILLEFMLFFLNKKGNYSYQAKASPLLHNLLYNITKSIKISDQTSVFDRWLLNDPDENKKPR